MINYNEKTFTVIQNSENGTVKSGMRFHYKQTENIIYCTYKGENVLLGHLIAIVRNDGSLDMRYHHVCCIGEIMTGICMSTPQIMENGKVRLYEKWKLTTGDLSEGQSTLEEV